MKLLFALLFYFVNASVVQAETVTASSLLCRELSAQKGAAYVEGVDVHGRAVAPADLGSDNQVMNLDLVRIPIDVDLAQRFGLALPNGVELKPTLGVMDISQDGRVHFNGREITQQAGAYCAGSQAAPFSAGKSLNGQAGADRIISNTDTGVQAQDVIEGQAN